MNVFFKKYPVELVLGLCALTMAAIGSYGAYKMKQGTDAYIGSVKKYDAILDRVYGFMDEDDVEVTVKEAKDHVDDEV